MGFDPLSWAIGFALTKSLQHLSSRMEESSLESGLSAIVDAWAQERPPGQYLSGEALFPRLLTDVEKRPFLAALRMRLGEPALPTLDEWHQALVEQWAAIRQDLGEDGQGFFRIDVGEAQSALRDLASRLERRCRQDESIFKAEALAALQELVKAHRASSENSQALLSPLPGSAFSDLRAVAHRIEDACQAAANLLFVDPDESAVHFWGQVPGFNRSDARRVLLMIARLLSGHAEAHAIYIGICDLRDLPWSDAKEPIAVMRIRFDADLVRALDPAVLPSVTFWESVSAEFLAEPNGLLQHWIQTPFSEAMR